MPPMVYPHIYAIIDKVDDEVVDAFIGWDLYYVPLLGLSILLAFLLQ